MKLDPWSIGSLGGCAAIVWQLLRFLNWFIRRRRPTEEPAPPTAESKRTLANFVAAFVIAIGITFGALVVVIVAAQQSSQQFRALSLLAGGVAALTLLGTLLLVLGVPAYTFTMKMKETNQVLEEKVAALTAQKQDLEERVAALETHVLAQQFPVPRKRSEPTTGRRLPKAASLRQ